jgi:hypothetical protein
MAAVINNGNIESVIMAWRNQLAKMYVKAGNQWRKVTADYRLQSAG